MICSPVGVSICDPLIVPEKIGIKKYKKRKKREKEKLGSRYLLPYPLGMKDLEHKLHLNIFVTRVEGP